VGAAKAGVAPADLTFAIAPTASLAGGVQIVARVIETGLHKMETLGFDVRRVVSGTGTAPLPPTAKSDMRCDRRTNDCVLYGGRPATRFAPRRGTRRSSRPAARLSTSSDYGTPFYDIFKRYDNDFYKIDPMLFSPRSVADRARPAARPSRRSP
jgi:methenyltetrahydromethanopterin cyclohydrolase